MGINWLQISHWVRNSLLKMIERGQCPWPLAEMWSISESWNLTPKWDIFRLEINSGTHKTLFKSQWDVVQCPCCSIYSFRFNLVQNNSRSKNHLYCGLPKKIRKVYHTIFPLSVHYPYFLPYWVRPGSTMDNAQTEFGLFEVFMIYCSKKSCPIRESKIVDLFE